MDWWWWWWHVNACVQAMVQQTLTLMKVASGVYDPTTFEETKATLKQQLVEFEAVNQYLNSLTPPNPQYHDWLNKAKLSPVRNFEVGVSRFFFSHRVRRLDLPC